MKLSISISRPTCFFLILALIQSSGFGKQIFVSSDDDFKDLNAGPGDEIIWRDGTYIDQGINLNATGSAEARLVVRAETPGGVIFKGKSFIRFGGDYITASGFLFTNSDDYDREIGSAVFQFRANNGNRHAHHCRVTECAIIDMNSWEQDLDDDDEDGDTTEKIFHSSKWIQLYGTNHRVDHCTFSQKKVRGALLLAELVPQDGESGTPYPEYNHRIDHNVFGPNPVGFSGNEFETIRLGTSDYANFNGNMVVEENFFDHCDGEIEVISNKSSHNTYRNNTLIGCQGSLVIRHGDFCRVERNVILGLGIAQTGGIRINGEGHTVVNNYVSGVRGTGLRAGLVLRCAGGVDTGDENGNYEQVRNALIAFNTLYDVTQSMNIGELGGKDNKYPPTESTIANNIVVSSRGTLVTWGKEPTAMTYEGNLMYGSAVGIGTTGFPIVNPMLTEGAAGIFRPAEGSPAIGASIGTYALIATDLDGEGRPTTAADVGADQVSATGVPLAPMDAASVGTPWLQSGQAIEVISFLRTGEDAAVLRFRRSEGLITSQIGLEAADRPNAQDWQSFPTVVEGPDDDGIFRMTIEVDTSEPRFWRLVSF